MMVSAGIEVHPWAEHGVWGIQSLHVTLQYETERSHTRIGKP